MLLTLFMAGCGLWREVQTESFSELTVDLQEFIGLNDPYRDRVKTLLDDAWIASHYDGVSTFAGISFEIAFDQCASDGIFDEAEFNRLSSLAEAFVMPNLDPGQRTTILRRKASMDAKVRASRGQQRRRGRSAEGGGDIANWVLPDDLRDVVDTLDWEVSSCDDDEIDGIQFAFCDLRQGQFFAHVQIDRYPKADDAKQASENPAANAHIFLDGDTFMTTTVLDGDSAATLRDAIVPEGDPVALLNRYELTRAVRGGSWEVDCTPLPPGNPELQKVNCEATKPGRSALIEVVINKAERKKQAKIRSRKSKDLKLLANDRTLRVGIAAVFQDESSLQATVSNEQVAKELADTILQ
ncbi:MAG: hypothetical protein AAGA48_24135 [Myxococcota bacterium]